MEGGDVKKGRKRGRMDIWGESALYRGRREWGQRKAASSKWGREGDILTTPFMNCPSVVLKGMVSRDFCPLVFLKSNNYHGASVSHSKSFLRMRIRIR